MPSQGCYPAGQSRNGRTLMKPHCRKTYHGVSPSCRAAYDGGTASTLPATLGCELTLIFHNAKNWDNCPALAQADLMMGDRLIGEAPEYTLEQWLRCDQIWPHVPTRLRFPICRLRLTLCKFSPMKRSPRRATTSFANLMDDATLTPLFNYHYRISAPPGVNGVRLTLAAGLNLAKLASAAFAVKKLVGIIRTRYHIGFRH